MADNSLSRWPLHERSNSQNNTSAIRLVPKTPPQLLGQANVHPNARDDDVYSRTPLPTHPSHILGPGKISKTRGGFTLNTPVLDEPFQKPSTPQSPALSSGSSNAITRTVRQPAHNAYSATPSPAIKPKPPARKRLTINKDGRTFSLLPEDAQPADESSGLKSPMLSSVSRTSFDSLPSYASNTARNSSISAFYALDEDSTLTTIPGTPPSEDENKLIVDHPGISQGNYQLVGGIRKVPKTPDSKQKGIVSSEGSLPPLPEILDDLPPTSSHDLSSKTSFHSTHTASTTSETSNYKVYRYTSPSFQESAAAVPSSSDSNYQILQESSSESSVIYRPQPARSESEFYERPSSDLSRESSIAHRPQTSNSDANYEIHGDLSPSASYLDHPYTSKYSQESLVVPALRPRVQRSNERLGYYKSRSRESLRSKEGRSRAGSLTSISTVLSRREAIKAVVGSGCLVHLPIPNLKSKGPSSWAEPSEGNFPQKSYMNENPHQWSSQLSTVLSVSDGGSARNSRSLSDFTGRHSTQSRTSRPRVSVSSSSFAQEDQRSRSNFMEPPQPAFARSGRRNDSSSSVRMIESQDEYGDGITDLHNLRARPSRTRLSGYYSISDNGRTNTMRSTTSTRANSLLAHSLPTWAKLYYGSGERRYLGGAPGSSTEDLESRSNSFRSGSPSTDNFPLNIYSPRRRPRESRQPGARASLEITPAPNNGEDGRVNFPGRRTWSMSSVWSPHLRMDRRAIRHSVWEPPSVNWSTEGSWFGRRNIQIIMFIAGFLFPFSWMIAALLPLPPKPVHEMQERDNSTSNLGISNDNSNDYERQFGPMDEARYESARWWRRLNRWMSLVGVLLLAAIIILVVVSLRERW